MPRAKKAIKTTQVVRADGTTYERRADIRAKGEGCVMLGSGGIYKVKLAIPGIGGYKVFSSRGFDDSNGKDQGKADLYRRYLVGQIAAGGLVLTKDTPTAYPDLAAAITAGTTPQKSKGAALTVRDLLESFYTSCKDSGQAQPKILRCRLDGIILPFFGDTLARDLNFDLLEQFKSERQDDGISNATLNRDFAVIHKAFKDAADAKRIPMDWVPKIKKLKESDGRQGWIDYDQYRTLLAAAPGPVKPLIAMAFWTGMRRGEILSMRWKWVDWDAQVIHLPGQVTKNGESRHVPLTHGSELREILWEHSVLHQQTCPDSPWIFFWFGAYGHGVKDGDRILDFREAWNVVVAATGIMGDVAEDDSYPPRPVIFHDLRRAFVKLMIDADVPIPRAMLVSGHKTDAVFRRYLKTKSADVVKVGERVVDYTKSMRQKYARRHLEVVA